MKVVKMEPLVMNRHVLTWLCMYPWDEDTSMFMKLVYITYTLVTFVVNGSAVFCAGAFIYKFVKTDLERCLYALLHIVAHSAIVYIQIAATLLQSKIKTHIFDHLAKIYAASTFPRFFHFKKSRRQRRSSEKKFKKNKLTFEIYIFFRFFEPFSFQFISFEMDSNNFPIFQTKPVIISITWKQRTRKVNGFGVFSSNLQSSVIW